MRYTETGSGPGVTFAARYQAGQPYDDLVEVARRIRPSAEAVEVPEWKVLLCRAPADPDDPSAGTDYETVEDGCWLACYGTVLLTLTDEEFNASFTEVPG